MSTDPFVTALADVCSPSAAWRPPRRVTVAEGAADVMVIKQPGGYVGNWSPDETPYMVEPMNMLASRRHEAVVFVGPARTGKCLALDTPIATPTGWTTMGALRVGDTVFGDDGLPTAVTYVAPTKTGRSCFAVRFSDGEELISDDEHLWGVERHYETGVVWRHEVRSTAEIAADITYRNRFRYRVRNAKPLVVPEADLPLDPYVLGVWLGNGTTAQASISAHVDDAGHYQTALARTGMGSAYRPDGPNTVWLVVPGLYARLRTMGLLGDKHVPATYLRASVEQRRALLQGLMDTDGTRDARQASAEFSTTLPALKDAVLELARSLGLKPRAREKRTTWVHRGERRFGRAFRITMPIPTGFEMFTLPRKAAGPTATREIACRQIVSVTPVASVPVRCIEVANASHLFLAGRGLIPTHNTMALLDGWIAYAAACDPGDFLAVQMTQEKAREFAKTRVDRMLRHSPKLKALMSVSAQADNTHDKMFAHGMWLRIGWPTVSQLSSSDYRYVAFTDYDRMDEDIGGEGAPFPLGLKRTQTFLSRGMCMVESSPGREVLDPHWRAVTPHEAPPCSGSLGIYNRSDRRRWYWQCPHCVESFEAAPGLALFGLPDEDELLEVVREADIDALTNDFNRVLCPHCTKRIGPHAKHDLNRKGRWLADGQTWRGDRLEGDAMVSATAGFWLGGVAATYQSWRSLINRYLNGLRDYALTGAEDVLKTTTNTDQGLPYTSRALLAAARNSAGPEDRKDKSLERYICPAETRFVVATVDNQGGNRARFVVQVHAVGPHLEQWLIDRYEITESLREGADGGKAPLDPARYVEDWDLITERVIRCTYRTPDATREIRPIMTVVDSAGEDGVTEKAYAWYRKLRLVGLHKRVTLSKGASDKKAPLLRESLVGGRNAKEKGDVPLAVFNPNLLKDTVSHGLKRESPGPGYIHLPAWLPRAFFDELQAEVRQADGTWMQIRKRNEAFDLAVLVRVGILRLGAEKIRRWENAPRWALPLAENSECMTVEDRREMKDNERVATAPEAPRPPAPRRPARRRAQSAYMR